MLAAMPQRTSISLDDTLLEAARRVLGTTGLKDTVESSLRETIRADRRRRLRERLSDPEGFDDEALGEARRHW